MPPVQIKSLMNSEQTDVGFVMMTLFLAENEFYNFFPENENVSCFFFC